MDLPAAADEDVVVVPEMPEEPFLPPPVPAEAPAEMPAELEDAEEFVAAADAEEPEDPYSAMPEPVTETGNALT